VEQSELYEYLSINGLGINDFHRTISSISDSDAFRIIGETCGKIFLSDSNSFQAKSTLFSFVANEHISGGVRICGETSCRWERVRELCEFTVLYGDKVLVRNPFDPYLDSKLLDDGLSDYIRSQLIGDIGIYWLLQPLVECGLVEFVKTQIPLCDDHYREFCNSEALSAKRKLQDAEEYLISEVREKVSFYLVNHDGDVYVQAEGPEAIIHEGEAVLRFRHYVPKALLPYRKVPGKHLITKRRVEKSGLLGWIIVPQLEDYQVQDWYAKHFDMTVLTNRESDLNLIQRIDARGTEPINQYFIEGLKHQLPTIASKSISTLLELRKENEEVFHNYRIELRKALTERGVKSVSQAKELFADTVQPEIEKIDKKIKNFRQAAVKSLAKDVLIYGGLVTVGLFSGLIPSNIAEIVGTIGGVEVTRTLIDKAGAIVKQPPSARENPYFFLWQAMRKKRHEN